MLNHTDTNCNDFTASQNTRTNDASISVAEKIFAKTKKTFAKNALRLSVSTLAGFAVLASLGLTPREAHAYTKQFGNVTVQVDGAVSFGTSIRAASRNEIFLPAGNGGTRVDNTLGVEGIIAGGLAAALPSLVPGLVASGALPADTNADNVAARYFSTRTVAEVIGDLGGAAVNPLAGLLAVTHTRATPEETTSLMATPIGAICGTAHNRADFASVPGTHCLYDNTGTGGNEAYNYDGGINSDDGRLNFDQGDLLSGNFKGTVDIQVSSGPFKFFTRLTAFYDAILDSDSSYERAGPSSHAEDQLGYDFTVLDLYFSVDTEIAELPFHLRVGKQVINWGEATFVLGGTSSFNPIDVGAIRRPGTEIKEALLPVEAIYGSLALTDNLTLEAYYGGWRKYELDPAGSPFAGADFVEVGSGVTSDDEYLARVYVGSGAYSGGNRRNCGDTTLDAMNPGNFIQNAATRVVAGVINGVFDGCGDAAATNLNILVPNARGDVERDRRAYENVVIAGGNEGVRLVDNNFLVRAEDDKSNGSDNYGIALRWYAEDLGSTEFGFYYQNYASRIPYISSRAYAPSTGISTTAPNASATLRGLTVIGCSGVAGAQIPNGQGRIRSFVHGEYMLSIPISDPTGLGAAWRNVFRTPNTFSNGAYNAGTDADIIIDAAATNYQARIAGDLGANTPSKASIKQWFTDIARNAVTNVDPSNIQPFPGDPNPTNIANLRPETTYAQAIELGCISSFAQSTAGQLLPTGATNLVTDYNAELYNEYPEDIDLYSFSFNTTLGDWGVQGEATYRPNMPLQLDVDAISIAALGASCAWENFSAAAGQLRDAQTIPTNCSASDWGKPIQGYVREGVFTFDVGTTATFTRSNPVVSGLGADLGILLTEIGVVHVPDADYYRQSNADTLRTDIPRLLGHCTSGSDLPLGGIFGLDPRGPLTETNALDPTQPALTCRPTPTSWGIVVLGQLQYNNAGGSPLTVRPTIAYSRGIDGRSPSPAGSFRKDVYSISLSVGLEYQSTWRASFGYTIFGGPELYTDNGDRDFVSMSVSYAFE